MTGDRLAKRATMSSMDIPGIPTLSAILKRHVRHRRKGLHAPKTGASRFLLLNAMTLSGVIRRVSVGVCRNRDRRITSDRDV